jgi:hypothetical protein
MAARIAECCVAVCAACWVFSVIMFAVGGATPGDFAAAMVMSIAGSIFSLKFLRTWKGRA